MSLEIDRSHIRKVAMNAAAVVAFLLSFPPSFLLLWKFPNAWIFSICIFIGGFFAISSLLVEIKMDAWIRFLHKYYLSHFDIEVHEI